MTVDLDADRTVDLGGGVRVSVVRAGTVKIDAGTVFGPVPWVLWGGLTSGEVDADGLISLASNCLLIETPSARVLVDTGPGASSDDQGIASALESAGILPETVTAVVLTTLERDHAGGLVRDDGRPTFPHARIVAQRQEWAIARSSNPRAMRRYDPVSLAPVAAAIEAGLIDGDKEVVPGVKAVHTGGYSLGHQAVVVRGDDATVAFVGDLLIRPWSANPRWVTSFDDRPLDSVERKAAIFAQAADEDWLVIASHEATSPVGRLGRDRDRFRFEAIAR
jgi:glyoxylase-like metal-dependent hydrolase (beta-lactamase superfamily II)